MSPSGQRTPVYRQLGDFLPAFEAGLPALFYHKIDHLKWDAQRRGLYVSPWIFRRQMEELHAAGFQTVGFDQHAVPARPGSRRFVLSFDDGFSSVARHAVPIMADAGFRAIQFVVPGLLGKYNLWDLSDGERKEPLMDESEIRDWLAAGHEIGSHTMSHPRLTGLSLALAREEIHASKKFLEDRFGRPVKHFCYPYGDWNEVVAAEVRAAGYTTACTVEYGVNQPETPPFALKRVQVVVSLRQPLDFLRSLAWGRG